MQILVLQLTCSVTLEQSSDLWERPEQMKGLLTCDLETHGGSKDSSLTNEL